MKFGIHNSRWIDTPDPAEAFEASEAKAQWAETHGCLVLGPGSHDPDPPRGAPDEPVLKGLADGQVHPWLLIEGLFPAFRRDC